MSSNICWRKNSERLTTFTFGLTTVTFELTTVTFELTTVTFELTTVTFGLDPEVYFALAKEKKMEIVELFVFFGDFLD